MSDYTNEQWVRQMRVLVERHGGGQRGKEVIAEGMGCSAALVGEILKGRYAEHLLEKWRNAFLDKWGTETVDCPVMGDIDRPTCAYHRGRAFAPTSPLRVRLFHTCPTCPFNPDSQQTDG